MQRFRLCWDYRQAFLMHSSGYHYDTALALILGSCYPCLYYGFYCEPHYKIGYLLLISLASLCTWPSLNHARPHKHFRSGCIHCFEPRIQKAKSPPCANQNFHCTGPVQHPACLSFIVLSWSKRPFPRNGLSLAPSRGRDVHHGCPTIASLSPLKFPDSWLICFNLHQRLQDSRETPPWQI